MHEKRLTARLTNYWGMLKKDMPLPLYQKLNPASLDDVWDFCMVVSVTNMPPAPPEFSFARMGRQVQSLYGKDCSGQMFKPGNKASPAASIVKRVEELLAQPEPIYDSGQFINPKHKIVKFRSCMLPFGQEQVVTHILIGLSWREFS